MQTDLATPGRMIALKGIIVQIIVSTIALLFAVFFVPEKVSSVMLGLAAFVFPHSIFAYWIFRYAGATKVREVARSLGQGSKIKLTLTTLIFVIAFAQLDADPLYLLAAYALIMVSQWTAMFYLGHS